MKKINIVELLKNCPKGMELDCAIFEGVEFDSIVDNDYFPIRCRVKNSNDEYTFYNFTKHGYWNNDYNAKCVIFPKGKTTWEGFVPPCKFKDGDVVATIDGTWVGITLGGNTNAYVPTYCVITSDNEFMASGDQKEEWIFNRLATLKEQKKLFEAIRDNGYYWNAETKTLEKLIEPKFKVGDRIKHRYRLTGDVYKVLFVLSNGYGGGVYDVAITNEIGKSIDIEEQDSYELVNKFDITTLKPFESKVLVRDYNSHLWKPAEFGFIKNEKDYYRYYVVGGINFLQCIPYEGNEHLLNTTDECDEYFKNW